MGTQANVLTPQQMRCIYALARGGGISNDDLHAVVFTTTGKDSIRLLTTADAKQVIDRLKRLTGQETTAPHNRPTKEQVAKIYALAAKLGWADDPKRLRAFLEKRFGASHPTFLDDKHARNCIEAMKAMLAGASAVEIASAVYERGLGVIAEMNRFVGSWMERHAFLAARDFVGRMNARNIPDPELYERTQFMKYYSCHE